MSKKEASIKQLKNCDDMHIYVQPIREYIDELEQALTELEELKKRDMPMKPVIKIRGIGNTWKIPYCPHCNNNVQSSNNYSFKYCTHCGQRLDWSDEE